MGSCCLVSISVADELTAALLYFAAGGSGD